jgi:MFS family permease
LLGWLVLPQSTPASARSGHAAARRERFDWLGATLFAVAIVAALVALTYANSWGLASTRFAAVGAVALVALAVFLAVERRAAHPLVDLSLFRRRLFSAGITAGLLSYAVLFGALFLVPFYLERILSHAPNEAGLLLSPVPVALGVVAPLSGVVTDRVGSRLPTVAGMVLAGLALAGLAAFSLVPLPVIVVLLGALGIGLGLFTPPNNSAIMSSAPSHRLGVAGGILNMTRSLGTSLGVALTGAVLAAFLAAETGAHVEGTVNLAPATLAPAFRATALFLAVLAALAAVISLARGPRPEHASTGAPMSAAGTGQSERERRERQLAGAEALGV